LRLRLRWRTRITRYADRRGERGPKGLYEQDRRIGEARPFEIATARLHRPTRSGSTNRNILAGERRTFSEPSKNTRVAKTRKTTLSTTGSVSAAKSEPPGNSQFASASPIANYCEKPQFVTF
jgi:hypothetical protein